MATKKTLIIEGSSNATNGDLRQGFDKLLSKKMDQNKPKIILGNGKSQAIKKFLHFIDEGEEVGLLMDLDQPEANRNKDLQAQKLEKYKDQIFYMIQALEAWFISQPEILDNYFNSDISKKLPKRRPAEIPEPKDALKKATKGTKKGEYHEIKHAVELLKRLDATKLESEFPDFKNLLTFLKK